MDLKTIKLTSIQPPADNPRRSFQKDSLEGLADSIKTDGLLQNLVVAPTKGKKFRIISGERRFRALQMLLKNGDITEDYEVPVEVKNKLSKQDTLRLATVENVQRENLHPMDEAEAFARLAQKGKSLSDLSAETGLTEKTIKRRLALASLIDEAKQLLRDGTITLSMAEALTVGTPEGQQDAVSYLEDAEYRVSPNQIRYHFTDNKPSMALAKFPLEQYTGTFTKDLFAEEDTTFFNDEEQFFELQRKAVTDLAEQYIQDGAAFVETLEGYSIPTWHYRDAKEDETGGFIINMTPTGKVEIIENVAKHDIDEETVEETAETPAAPAKKKPFYTAALCRYMGHHKSVAVQSELLGHPQLCTILLIIQLLGSRSTHEALKAFAKSETRPLGYDIISETADKFLDPLPEPEYYENIDTAWSKLKCGHFDQVKVYDTLKTFDDEQLDKLLALLTVVNFGQTFCDRLDTHENSLFNRVANDMQVNMLDHWTPDEAFLNRRSKDQLIDMAIVTGANTTYGAMSSLKKSEIVKNMERYFAQAKQSENPSEDDIKAKSWLPEAMQFPAIDPMQEQEEEGSLPETA